MKRKMIFPFLFLLISTMIFADDPSDHFGYGKKKTPEKPVRQNSMFSAGLGYGIPYGVLGVIAEIAPVQYLGICAGLGFAIEGVGYSLGVRIYPTGSKGQWAPMISGYYGVVGAILDQETFTGGAFGGGVRYIAPTRKWSVSTELLYLVYDEKPGVAYGGKIKMAGGVQWRF